MNKEHVISEEATNEIQLALSKNENLMAYNNAPYFLEREDMYFFKGQHEANEFAANNISDQDSFQVIHFGSLADVFRQIPYGENLSLHFRIDPDANPLNDKDGNAFTDSLIEHWEKEQIKSSQNKNIMNQENLDYLKNTLKYMGFGDKLNNELEDNIKKGTTDININAKSTFNNKQIEAMLSFRKGEQNEMYFFNKYTAAISKDGQPDLDRSQTFYVNKGNGVTFKEAFNLLEGRAVNKNLTDSHGNKYNAWLQLDFDVKDKHGNHEVKQYHQNYGYDLEKAVSTLPIIELNNVDDRKLVMDALKKGNLWEVNIDKDGSKEKIFIQADPKHKTVNAFDFQKEPVKLESLRKEKSKENSAGKEEKQENKNEEKKQSGKRRSKDELEEDGQRQGRRR